MDEENKCHVLLKAIWSMWWLLVIIWCADVSTHRRHRMEGGGRQHRPTVGKIGSGVNGQCFSKLLIILIWPSVYGRLPGIQITVLTIMARSSCFTVGGQVFLFSCNDLILYTLISRVNPPPWTTTHRGPNVVGGDGHCCTNLVKKPFLIHCRFKISSKLVCPSYFGCHAAGDELIIEAGIFVG